MAETKGQQMIYDRVSYSFHAIEIGNVLSLIVDLTKFVLTKRGQVCHIFPRTVFLKNKIRQQIPCCFNTHIKWTNNLFNSNPSHHRGYLILTYMMYMYYRNYMYLLFSINRLIRINYTEFNIQVNKSTLMVGTDLIY
jgi:hypothetical protein